MEEERSFRTKESMPAEDVLIDLAFSLSPVVSICLSKAASVQDSNGRRNGPWFSARLTDHAELAAHLRAALSGISKKVMKEALTGLDAARKVSLLQGPSGSGRVRQCGGACSCACWAKYVDWA